MTLVTKCINIIAKPEVLEMYKSQLALIPIDVKIHLLKILCKRGCIKDGHTLRKLVNLKVIEMDLSECNVTDDMLSCLNVCKNLQKLDLSLRRRQTRSVTKEGLNSLFSYLPCLKILAVPDCKELNDEVMKTVCENCIQLKELYIPNSSITDLSLQYIGQNFSQLSVINILGTLITDRGIQSLISGPLSKTLSEINISKCPNLSSHSGGIVAKECFNIKIFSFESGCSNEDLVLAMNGIHSKKAKQVFWTV